MTRALRAALDIVYHELDFDRIEITGDVGNSQSEAIPHRLGFTFEGITRHARWDGDCPVDYWTYSLLADEWPAKSREV